jgi:hypothetical protein
MNERKWEEKAGVPLDDPNFEYHLREALANEKESILKQALADLGLNIKIISGKQKLSLHPPKANATVVYGET